MEKESYFFSLVVNSCHYRSLQQLFETSSSTYGVQSLTPSFKTPSSQKLQKMDRYFGTPFLPFPGSTLFSIPSPFQNIEQHQQSIPFSLPNTDLDTTPFSTSL